MEDAIPFFVGQQIIVTAEVVVRNNIFITVDPRSYIKQAENIEKLLVLGSSGQILDIGNDWLLLYFFPAKDAIRIRVMKTYFSSRFKSTNMVWQG